MRAGSLFTGIGGLDLATTWALGAEPAWMCETDHHCRTILEQRFPHVPILPDIRELDHTAGPIDLLHGGYPCQPFSVAGKRGGENDPRHLWPEFARCVRVLRPRLVIAENVAGHLTLGFDRVLCDLAEMGFDVRWGVVRASDTGAPHQRARLFWVAWDADRQGLEGRGSAGQRGHERSAGQASVGATAHTDDGRCEQRHRGLPEPCQDSVSAADAALAERRSPQQHRVGAPAGSTTEHRERAGEVAWGVYEPAIRRWEAALGRPAPRPTDDRGRLMPQFVEWMMGFPHGWTEGVARTHRLRMLGNAVVPQQGALALRLLAHIQARQAA